MRTRRPFRSSAADLLFIPYLIVKYEAWCNERQMMRPKPECTINPIYTGKEFHSRIRTTHQNDFDSPPKVVQTDHQIVLITGCANGKQEAGRLLQRHVNVHVDEHESETINVVEPKWEMDRRGDVVACEYVLKELRKLGGKGWITGDTVNYWWDVVEVVEKEENLEPWW
jgi:hypothetical protein